MGLEVWGKNPEESGDATRLQVRRESNFPRQILKCALEQIYQHIHLNDLIAEEPESTGFTIVVSLMQTALGIIKSTKEVHDGRRERLCHLLEVGGTGGSR
ncbi:hypothetical protein M0802_006550 [Mischocyttarus mexicanus]|nr:hypothetical protein M0802_006550 [Mischocyttarus mexicanus]